MTSLAIMARSRSRDERPKQLRGLTQNILVSARPGNLQQGFLRFGNIAIHCALGQNGIGILKREGDGKTPLAKMEILFGFYQPGRWPIICRQPWFFPASHTLGWCDAPPDRNYNRAVALPYAVSHETLARNDGLYDCAFVLNWNMKPRARNRGSAIFLHIARQGYQPTEGCIAVSRSDMMRLAGALKPGIVVKTLA